MSKYLLRLQTQNGVQSTQTLPVNKDDLPVLFEQNSYGFILLNKLFNDDKRFTLESSFDNSEKVVCAVIQGAEEFVQNRWSTTPRDLDMVLGVLEGQAKFLKNNLDPVEHVKLILLCKMLGIKE